MCAAVLLRDADRGQKAEIAEAPAERDRVVDGTAAGVEHDGRAADLPPAGKIVEILRRVSGDDADRADPAAAVGLAGDPGKFHRQLALFERAAGAGRRTESRDGASQHNSTSGGSHQQPAAKIERLQKFQTGPFPKPKPLSLSRFRQAPMFPESHTDVTKMVSGGIQIVHRYLLHCSLKAGKIWRVNNSLQFPALEPNIRAHRMAAERT